MVGVDIGCLGKAIAVKILAEKLKNITTGDEPGTLGANPWQSSRLSKV